MQTVKERIEQRTLDEANYIIANKTTVRATAQAYDKSQNLRYIRI